MKLQVYRYNDTGDATLGLLMIDGKFECYTLEDQEQAEKVAGETRIPEGVYDLKQRFHGGHYNCYVDKYEWHSAMFQVMDVSGFTDILIHVGNKDEDTEGCLLLGSVPTSRETIGQSAVAYKAF